MSPPRMAGFSPRVLSRIEDAGASAYAWHDKELTAFLDPSRVWTRLSGLIATVGLYGSLAGLLALSWATEWWLGGVVTVLFVGGLLRRGFTAMPALVLMGAGVLAAATSGVWAAVTTAVAMGLLRGFVAARWQAVSGGIVALAVLLATSLDAGLPAVLAAVVVGTVLGVAAGGVGGGRGLALPMGRIDKSALTQTIPAPPSRVPWLVRVVKRGSMREVPAEIEKKKAGAYGERRTALLLLGLKTRQGTRIFHDVLIPGAATANADHVVLARSGLYVIDTKQFGSRHDPGEVVLDSARGDIVHRTSAKVMPLAKSMQTVTWAARAVSAVAGVPATPLLAVHNAAVAPGLRAMMPDGLLLDVVSSDDLIARIENAPAVFSAHDLTRLARHLSDLEAATGDGTAQAVRPIGLATDAKQMRGAWAGAVPAPVEFGGPGGPPPPAAPPAATPPTTTTGTQPAAPSVSSDSGHGAAESTPPQHAALASAANRPAGHDLQTPILERWASMKDSEPAAPDEVPDDLRGLGLGDPIYVITFTDGDVRSQKSIAMSGVCRGTKGVTYVWVCSPTDWAIHQAHGRPVHVETVHAQQVMVRDSGSGGGDQ